MIRTNHFLSFLDQLITFRNTVNGVLESIYFNHWLGFRAHFDVLWDACTSLKPKPLSGLTVGGGDLMEYQYLWYMFGAIFVLYIFGLNFEIITCLGDFPENILSVLTFYVFVCLFFEDFVYEAVYEWVTERVFREDKTHSTGLTMSDPDILVPNEPSWSQLFSHA